MFENFNNQIKKETAEICPTFEGRDTESLISRLHNPVIKEQIIDIKYRKKLERRQLIKDGDWIDYLPEGWDGTEQFKLKLDKKSGKVLSDEELEKEQQVEVSRENIERELDQEIEEIENKTEIDFTTNGPNGSVIPLNWVVPWTGEKATKNQKSIIEAHEKGHWIRDYNHLTDFFREAFDISKANFTERDYELIISDTEGYTDKPLDWDKDKPFVIVKEQYLNEYLFTGIEIAERMSQLKNYFGFRGAEQFTSEHLRYAKEHYIEDTNMDNSMRLFFEAITPETEERFLGIINNYGI